MHLDKKKERKRKLISLIVLVVLLLVAAAVTVYFLWEKAPVTADERSAATESTATASAAETATVEEYEDTKAENKEAEPAADEPEVAEEVSVTSEPSPSPTPPPEPTPEPVPEGTAPLNAREDGVYTVLIVGEDKWTGNTDTILVGKIDTNAHKMDFVSIPRDTLINVDWDVRKINSVYYRFRELGRDPAQELKSKIRDIVGFEVDCYAIVNLEAFIQVIDAVGGVEYELAEPLYYEDYTLVDGQWQDSYHDIPAGKQTLTGHQAMGLVRYRHGYAGGDMDRIKVQHDFLRACAKQFISLGNIPNVGKVIDILAENIDTDMSAANIAWFFRQALMCKPENINFHTMPNSPQTLGGGYSYAVILVYQWRDMINEVLNPYSQPLTINDLNVVYKDVFGYGCTRETQGAWYFVGAREAEMMAAGLLPAAG